eukprot:UN09383
MGDSCETACPTGYDGTDCTNDIDECAEANQPCVNGTCEDNIGSYECICDDGFGGEHCDVQCDPGFDGENCENDMCASCSEFGRCNSATNYTCDCFSGYTGDDCDENR